MGRLTLLFSAYFCATSAVKLDKLRPVTRVIKILQDMGKRLQDEQRADEAIYEKMNCWCTDNDKEKSEAVELAQTTITALTASIEDKTARSSQLETEITQLGEEVAANKQALKTASELRKKERDAFNEEHKEVLETLEALDAAIVILKKHNSPSELVQSAVSRILGSKHVSFLTSRQRSAIKVFLQSRASQPAFTTAYQSQSGEIFGILRQMKDEFEKDMGQALKDEENREATFKELKAAKEAEIAASQEKIDNKIQEKADADEQCANDKQELEDTRTALAADQRFLVDLKLKCQQTDKEWEDRQALRAEEIKAVSEAISILQDDDAHDLFSKTLSLLQVRKESSQREREDHAAAFLKGFDDPRMAALATKVQLDAFTKVKKAIDDMVAQLKAEKQDEVQHRDFCISELHENESQSLEAGRNKEAAEAKVATLQQTMEQLSTDLNELEKQNAEIKVQMKRAGEDREAENQEFQSTIRDQRQTWAILDRAVRRLQKFYAPQAASPHPSEEPTIMVQISKQPEWEKDPSTYKPPPGTFKSYMKQMGGGVISLLKNIMDDTKKLETDCLNDEQSAQRAYEEFVKDSNQSLGNNNRMIVDKTENRATAESELTLTEGDLKGIEADIQRLVAYAADVHKSCDFLLQNFDVRQMARDQEIEALQQAKAILSGSDFE